jgi:transcriptional regulator with PAS, ATPase and Fis domain
MKQVMEIVRRVAPTNSNVLILGESGTGKELLARAIHKQAQTARPTDGKFLAINCAAIPTELLENQLFGHRRGAYTGADKDSVGLFVHAGDGTVFLDEIGDLPLMTQAKLLRVIEQKEVLPVGANEPVTANARILAATNKDLAAEVAAGRFRNDLYFRLNVVSVTLPALRDRLEDLPQLIEFQLTKYARNVGKKFTALSHDAMKALLVHRWTGNIRELDNAIHRAVILGDPPLITPADLPPSIGQSAGTPSPFGVDDLEEANKRFEKLHIERILAETPDKKDAAKRLGIGVSSLYRKIEAYGIDTDSAGS